MNSPSPASVVETKEANFYKLDASISVLPPVGGEESLSKISVDTKQYDNDIDERDSTDPLCATDYVQELYEHFRSKESVIPDYMESQPRLDEQDRDRIINWLFKRHKGEPEVLYLAVNLVDRYLAQKQVTLLRLELVAITALWIASKYEEIYCLSVHYVIAVCEADCGVAYTPEEIYETEAEILSILDYRMTIPTARDFLKRFLKGAYADEMTSRLANYILDGTLASYSLQHYLPSQLAAASTMIACTSQGRSSWNQTLWQFSGYSQGEIEPIARAIQDARAALFENGSIYN